MRRSVLLVYLLLCAATFPSLAKALSASASMLSCGATLIASEQPNLPIVTIRVILDAGSRRDPQGKGGLAYLTADLLTEGTASRSAEQINEAIDSMGASLNTSAGSDYAEVSLGVLTKDLDTGFDLMADVLLRPAFAATELERRRESVLASIRAARDDPTSVATDAFLEALFGTEPYAHPVEGTEDTVSRIGRNDVREFYARQYRPAGAVVVVVGDIEEADARARFERALAGWSGGVAPFEVPPAVARPAQRVRIDKSVTQASVVLGQTGIARNDPDYEIVSVMNYVLGGGGFSSRLMNSVRTEAGLAYSVSSSFSVSKTPGWFWIVLQTKNASVDEAVARSRAEVERMTVDGITDEELEDAKSYLTGSFPLRLDSNSEMGSFLAQTWFYGLGLDYADVYAGRVRAVGKEDVLRVARKYLQPERLIEVVVGDLKQVDSLPAAP